MSGADDPYQHNVRRDAWRGRLLHAQVREEMAKRRDDAAMRAAIAVGVVIGVFGSYLMGLI